MGREQTAAEREVNAGKEGSLEEARDAEGVENKVEEGAP